MFKKYYIIVILFVGLFANTLLADYTIQDKQLQIVMRTIGHEVLLQSGDSTSIVLPIEQDGQKFSISFENDFIFTPQTVINAIDNIIVDNDISCNYLVEVEDCMTHLIVYAYQMVHQANQSGFLPCGQREYHKDCYTIHITLLDELYPDTPIVNNATEIMSDTHPPHQSSSPLLLWTILPVLGIMSYTFYTRQKQEKTIASDEATIQLGNYSFNKNNMLLTHGDNTIELTSKEADLLIVFYNNINQVLSREEIRKEVWKNEEDYVGRTLDVFVSKLRKHLASDSQLKIITIRGVGYKFITDAQ